MHAKIFIVVFGTRETPVKGSTCLHRTERAIDTITTDARTSHIRSKLHSEMTRLLFKLDLDRFVGCPAMNLGARTTRECQELAVKLDWVDVWADTKPSCDVGKLPFDHTSRVRGSCMTFHESKGSGFVGETLRDFGPRFLAAIVGTLLDRLGSRRSNPFLCSRNVEGDGWHRRLRLLGGSGEFISFSIDALQKANELVLGKTVQVYGDFGEVGNARERGNRHDHDMATGGQVGGVMVRGGYVKDCATE